jgi:hypothetical protein
MDRYLQVLDVEPSTRKAYTGESAGYGCACCGQVIEPMFGVCGSG